MGFLSPRFLAFAAASILAGCRPQPSPTIVLDPALAPLIPHDTTILAGIRIDQLKKTELYARLRSEGKLKPLADFERETGIDLEKRVFDILIASNSKTAVALVRVQFVTEGTAGVEPPLGKPGTPRFSYKGYTLAGEDSEKGFSATYFNRSVIVAGPTPMVKGAIDSRDGSKGGPPKALLERVKTIPSSNQVWAVSFAGIATALPTEIPGPLGGLRGMPIDIRSIVGAVDVSKGVKASAEIVSGDEKNATKLNDAVKGIIGIGRLSTPDSAPELLKFYDAIQVTRERDTVRVSADVPMTVVEQLLAAMSERKLI